MRWEMIHMKDRSLIKKIFSFRETGVVIALIVLMVIFTCSTEIFLTGNNLLNITRQISVTSLLAISMTFVIITGGIDLSVGSVIAFSGIMAASMIKDYDMPVLFGMLAGVVLGLVTGLVNGLFISYLKMPAFITTMGTMTILRGLGYIYTQAYPIYDLPTGFKIIGQGYIWIIPVPTIILIVIAVIAYIILKKTVLGRHIYAIGGNADASALAGIRVKRIQLCVYMISGCISGLAAVVQAAIVGSGLPTIGEGFEMDAIAAAVIGGAAMSGGSGTILGTILGSVLLGVLSNGLSLLDVDSYIMTVISGCVVILAVLIDQIRTIMAKNAQIRKTKESLAEKKQKAV